MSPEPPLLAYISYDEFLADIEAIAGRLAAAKWRPDFVVGIGRGGLVPATFLSHRIEVPMLSVDQSSQVPDFSSALIPRLAKRSRGGDRLLFVDDINDSGSTITHLRHAYSAAGGVEERMRFAVLINNLRSNAVVDLWSRTIDRATDKRWLVFPWEAVSRVSTLTEDAAAVPDRLA
jgi:hypoxanthine phosphoribosyltransferase